MIHPDIKDCERVERELAQLRTERDTLKGENEKLRGELADRTTTIYRADKLHEIWYWQGDGFDDLESITCPILIPADTLRNVMNVGADTGLKLEAAEAARQEAVAALEADASDLWDVTNAIKNVIQEKRWIVEGPGSYRYDDDRYRQETKASFDAIEKLIANVQHPAQLRFHAALGKGETIVSQLATEKQARQDTVRELASAQEQYMHRIKQIEDLTTRLTKAEAELEVTRKALKESLVMFPRDFFPKAYASFCAALQPGEPK